MEQEFDHRLPCEAETVESSMRDPEQHNEDGTLEAAASTSSSHDRRDNYEELPKEMNEMKIRDESKPDDHEENAKVGIPNSFSL